MPSACLDQSQKFHYVIYDVPFSSFRFFFFFIFTFIFISVARVVREAEVRHPKTEATTPKVERGTNKTDREPSAELIKDVFFLYCYFFCLKHVFNVLYMFYICFKL